MLNHKQKRLKYMPPDQNPVTPPGEFQQVIERLRSANNVLVTISNNPSVDQFAACIGLTLILNKLNKHANAVFSGSVPSTIDFLKPEDTIEQNTDSLRDFIIALDKSKADKLRYKVENDVVKIFITPYRTNISETDLNFSHGDFNVDAVVALGVKDKSHLDAAILAHGRILHDAAVISVNNGGVSSLGSINWSDAQVSSLCEMVADVAKELASDVFDKQNATALLTGIVAETARYSNEKATPHTMSIAGILMSAGASTQLVSSKLEAPKEHTLPKVQDMPKENTPAKPADDGVIEIDHNPVKDNQIDIPKEPAASDEENDFDPANQILIDEHGQIKKVDEADALIGDKDSALNTNQPKPVSRMIHQPPSRTGRLTANDQPEDDTVNADPLSQSSEESTFSPAPQVAISPARATGDSAKPKNVAADKTKSPTLSDIEQAVSSPHAINAPEESDVPELELDETRKAVNEAVGIAEIDGSSPQVRDDLGSTSFEETVSNSNDDESSPPPKVPPPMIPST